VNRRPPLGFETSARRWETILGRLLCTRCLGFLGKLCASNGISAPNAIREVEKYQVELSDVTAAELVIVPDISRGASRASLRSLHNPREDQRKSSARHA
jgi:hypothetical protein